MWIKRTIGGKAGRRRLIVGDADISSTREIVSNLRTKND